MQTEAGAIHMGDRVKVVRIGDDVDDLTREYVSCFLGRGGVVGTEPKWLPPAPEKGSLGKIVARGECWVEFDSPCQRHGDTGAAFEVSELEKIGG
jgi:hypothetical protein